MRPRPTRTRLAGGQVGGDHRVESRDLPAQLLVAGEHARGIASPVAAAGLERRPQVEQCRARFALGTEGSHAIPTARDSDRDTPFDRHRHDEAVVVVRVLTDQVDAPGSVNDEGLEGRGARAIHGGSMEDFAHGDGGERGSV